MAAPVITAHPSDVYAVVSGSVVFSVTATGATSYQWTYLSGGTWATITGATSDSYTVPTASVTLLNSGRQYRCSVTNTDGTTHSLPASMTVYSSVFSRVELYQAEIMSTCLGITAATGYRTTVSRVTAQLQDLSALHQLPQVSVLLGAEKMQSLDTNKNVWHSDVETFLLGYCNQSGMEALIHDLKLVMKSVALSEVNSQTNRWVIRTDNPGSVIVSRDILPGTEKGWVCVQFTARVFAQAGTL